MPSKLKQCVNYIVRKTGCKASELELRETDRCEEYTQFRLVNAFALVCEHNTNFAEYYRV